MQILYYKVFEETKKQMFLAINLPVINFNSVYYEMSNTIYKLFTQRNYINSIYEPKNFFFCNLPDLWILQAICIWNFQYHNHEKMSKTEHQQTYSSGYILAKVANENIF